MKIVKNSLFGDAIVHAIYSLFTSSFLLLLTVKHNHYSHFFSTKTPDYFGLFAPSVKKIVYIKRRINGFMCEAAIDKTRLRLRCTRSARAFGSFSFFFNDFLSLNIKKLNLTQRRLGLKPKISIPVDSTAKIHQKESVWKYRKILFIRHQFKMRSLKRHRRISHLKYTHYTPLSFRVPQIWVICHFRPIKIEKLTFDSDFLFIVLR